MRQEKCQCLARIIIHYNKDIVITIKAHGSGCAKKIYVQSCKSLFVEITFFNLK